MKTQWFVHMTYHDDGGPGVPPRSSSLESSQIHPKTIRTDMIWCSRQTTIPSPTTSHHSIPFHDSTVPPLRYHPQSNFTTVPTNHSTTPRGRDLSPRGSESDTRPCRFGWPRRNGTLADGTRGGTNLAPPLSVTAMNVGGNHMFPLRGQEAQLECCTRCANYFAMSGLAKDGQ